MPRGKEAVKALVNSMALMAFSAMIMVILLLSFVSGTDPALPEYAGPIIENPITLSGDPYLSSTVNADDASSDAVCGIIIDATAGKYSLKTFINRRSAEESGFSVTHHGNCGTCSTLQDLHVYKKNPDLTGAVRTCSITLLNKAWTMHCLRNLGFTEHCAETWYYNMINTGRKCFLVCALSWLKGEDYNNPDGSLNPCLKCDEEESGPVFKHYAGRTRRNSGLLSEIKRPGHEVNHVLHDYLE